MAGLNGISSIELQKQTGKDRNIITAICKELENSSHIRIDTKVKPRVFYPTDRAMDLNFFYARLLGSKRMQFFSAPYSVIPPGLTDVDIENEHLRTNSFHRHYSLGTNRELAILEKFLHDFSTRIGIFITYLLIRASSPDFVKKLAPLEISSNLRKYQLVIEWIKYATLSPIDLLSEFVTRVPKQCEDTPIYLDEPRAKKVKGDPNNKSSYELDQKIVNRLFEVFSNMYPESFKSLESIYDNLEDEVKRQREQTGMVACDHKFEYKLKKGPELIQTRVLNDGSKIYYTTQKGVKEFHCNKCNRNIIQNLDHEISSELRKRLNSTALTRVSENINKSEKSKNYRYRKLKFTDVFKSPYVFRCKHSYHVWERVTNPEDEKGAFLNGHALLQNFQCILCYENRDWIILDEKTVKAMRETIKDKVGEDRDRLALFDTIAYHFYKNENEWVTSNDLNFLKPEKLEALEIKYSYDDFEKDKKGILKVLLNHGFIDLEKSNTHSIDEIWYIRRAA